MMCSIIITSDALTCKAYGVPVTIGLPTGVHIPPCCTFMWLSNLG